MSVLTLICACYASVGLLVAVVIFIADRVAAGSYQVSAGDDPKSATVGVREALGIGLAWPVLAVLAFLCLLILMGMKSGR